MFRKRTRLWTVLALAALASVGSPAGAQRREARLSERGYQEIRHRAHDLDRLAAHAADQALHSRVWVYRNDSRFARAVVRFAQSAHRFHERMDRYQTRPWQVDEELAALLRDARNAQYRAEHARQTDDHTISDWNRVVDLLNDMIRVYRADVARRSWEPDYDSERRYLPQQPERYAPPPSSAPPDGRYPPRGDRSGLVDLAGELAQRADRIANYSRTAAGPFLGNDRQRVALDTLEHFRDQARLFRERVESGLSGSALAASARHLASDARSADERIGGGNLFPQIRSEWEEVLRLVDRIQAIAS